MTRLFRVTAELQGPIAVVGSRWGTSLDAIVEACVAQRNGVWRLIDKSEPCPPPLELPIPRENIGGWPVPRCSDVIVGESHQSLAHIKQSLDATTRRHVGEEFRRTINERSGAFKMYRLPIQRVLVPRVHWICRATSAADLLDLLVPRKDWAGVTAIGRKRCMGYGIVSRWSVDPWHGPDVTWMAFDADDLVLMRTLPAEPIPEGTRGAYRTFGGVIPPYWHPERMTEIVVPC